MQRSYPQTAQHPPASSTSTRLTFCSRRVTASPTHLLHRHRRSPWPREYSANSVSPCRTQVCFLTRHVRVDEGGRPVLYTCGFGGRTRSCITEHMFLTPSDRASMFALPCPLSSSITSTRGCGPKVGQQTFNLSVSVRFRAPPSHRRSLPIDLIRSSQVDSCPPHFLVHPVLTSQLSALSKSAARPGLP